MLRKIGDTLGVLGLGELRASVQGETERLGKIASGELKPDETTLVQIAATLIGVEDKLDDRLIGMILPRAAQAEQQEEDTEFQLVQGAVLRECILNLARVKEAISQNVGGLLDVAGLDSWQDLMRGIEAGLLMLGKTRAMKTLDADDAPVEARDAARRRRAARRIPRPPRRRDRQRRVLHGDAAVGSHRSVVHARQRGRLPADARK